MAWDPTTGMWSPDVTRQPLGALGSAMQFFNAGKARDISGRRNDLLQTELESNQFKLNEAQEQAQRYDELRAALSELPANVDTETLINTYGRFGDPSKLPTLYRAMESGDTKRDVQGLRNKGASELLTQKEGLPSTQATIDLKGAQTENLREKTEYYGPMQDAIIAHMEETDRIKREALTKLKGGGRLTSAEIYKLQGRKADILNKIAMTSKSKTERDPMNFKFKKLTPEQQASVDAWQKQVEELDQILQFAGGGAAAPTASAAAPAAPPTAPAASDDDPLSFEKRGIIAPKQ